MQFGSDKCAVLKMKRRKKVHYEGIDLGDKFLGILERNDIFQEKMKEKVQKEYYKRARAVLKSKLNVGNIINAINIWAVATVRYEAGIINWNKGELDKID